MHVYSRWIRVDDTIPMKSNFVAVLPGKPAHELVFCFGVTQVPDEDTFPPITVSILNCTKGSEFGLI